MFIKLYEHNQAMYSDNDDVCYLLKKKHEI